MRLWAGIENGHFIYEHETLVVTKLLVDFFLQPEQSFSYWPPEILQF